MARRALSPPRLDRSVTELNAVQGTPSGSKGSRPVPPQGLVDRMVIDAESPANRGDGEVALAELGRFASHRLIDRSDDRVAKLNRDSHGAEGSHPLRSRPPLPLSLTDSTVYLGRGPGRKAGCRRTKKLGQKTGPSTPKGVRIKGR